MGSDETAITIPGGPRVIDVFYGNGAPSGPNYLLFSDVDRRPDSLGGRSRVMWSTGPHAPVLGAPQRALDRKLGGIMVQVRAWCVKTPPLFYVVKGVPPLSPLSYVVRGATPFSSRKKEKTGFIEKGAGSLPASLGLYPLGRGTR